MAMDNPFASKRDNPTAGRAVPDAEEGAFPPQGGKKEKGKKSAVKPQPAKAKGKYVAKGPPGMQGAPKGAQPGQGKKPAIPPNVLASMKASLA